MAATLEQAAKDVKLANNLHGTHEVLASIAISLKRIADELAALSASRPAPPVEGEGR